VYTKAEGGAPGALNVGVLAVDAGADEMSVFQAARGLGEAAGEAVDSGTSACGPSYLASRRRCRCAEV